MTNPITIRPLEAGDHHGWRALWTGYLAFYETTVSEAVFDSTWQRLLGDGEYEPHGLIALREDKPVGIVHFLMHRHCWRVENVCYLQDLYVTEAARGTGLGQALIEAVYARADQIGCPNVYWMTQDFNESARRLYDRIGVKTPFIRYQRKT